MTPFQERIHDVSAALAQLQIEILDERAAWPAGSLDAHAIDSLLEATAILREAFDGFVQAATLNVRASSDPWVGERA